MSFDKKISICVVFLILLTSVFSIPIKSIINDRILGGLIFTSLEIFLYGFLFASASIRNSRIICHSLDYPVILYFFYGLFLLLWSFIHNNGTAGILKDFRLHFLPVILYFVLRYYLSYDYSLFSSINRVILVIITILVVESYFEIIASKVLGWNTGLLPWVDYIQSARDVPYYIGTSFSRPIGMFAYIHPTGLLAVCGYILFLLEYRVANRPLYKYLSIFCFIGVFVIGSRTSIVVLVIVMLYLSRISKKLRKDLIVYSLLIILIVSTFFLSELPPIMYVHAHISNTKAFFTYNWNDYINFTPLPGESILINMIYWTYGTGLGYIHHLFNRYTSYAFCGIDITLISFLFQYGLIFILIIGYIFLQVFRAKTHDSNIHYYKAVMMPFMFSLLHYAEMYAGGILEVFFTIYALTITYIIKSQSNRILQSAQND